MSAASSSAGGSGGGYPSGDFVEAEVEEEEQVKGEEGNVRPEEVRSIRNNFCLGRLLSWVNISRRTVICRKLGIFRQVIL